MNSVYSYTDYRQFLRDCYLARKTAERRFSYRSMAASLGFAAPNFLKLVIDGKRNIGRESIGKIASGLNLNKGETEYFSYLVFFEQAGDPVEKNYYFGCIASMRSHKSVTLLEAEQFEYFSSWYHPAVREIVCGMSDPLDYGMLSRRLDSAVSPLKIRRSVTMLLRLGLLRRDEDGSYRQCASALNTENELNSFAVRRYHEQVLDIARKSLHSVPAPEREIASATVHLSESGFKIIKSRLQSLREELLQIAGADTDQQEVYHVNFQLYPLTRSVQDENDR